MYILIDMKHRKKKSTINYFLVLFVVVHMLYYTNLIRFSLITLGVLGEGEKL